MDADAVLADLRSRANEHNRAGMARFGINAEHALGISVTDLRKIAKPLGRDHRLAAALWRSGIHEARILAALVDEPDRVTEAQAERWVRDFDSWDLCDQVCANLFDRTSFAFAKAKEWARRDPEFERRAGFALMAALAWHDRTATDESFLPFFPLIVEAANDDRNFVRKSVNWALRQIGKRSALLHAPALGTARQLCASDDRTARWIGRDALRELEGPKVLGRLGLAD